MAMAMTIRATSAQRFSRDSARHFSRAWARRLLGKATGCDGLERAQATSPQMLCVPTGEWTTEHPRTFHPHRARDGRLHGWEKLPHRAIARHACNAAHALAVRSAGAHYRRVTR